MRIVAGDSSLNCDALDKPELINPEITDETKGCDLQQLQEQQLSKWSDYLYQVGGGKSPSPLSPSNKSSPYTHNTWNTTALPSCNSSPSFKNGS